MNRGAMVTSLMLGFCAAACAQSPDREISSMTPPDWKEEEKEWNCKTRNNAKRALILRENLGDNGNRCVHLRDGITVPHSDEVKVAVVKRAESLTTLCPVVFLPDPVHYTGCASVQILHKDDLMKIEHAPVGNGRKEFVLTVWRPSGDIVVDRLTLTPKVVSQDGDVAWLSNEDTHPTRAFFVYLEHHGLVGGNLKKNFRLEVFEKNASGQFKCQTHLPSVSHQVRDCNFRPDITERPIVEGNTGSGGEPPPTGGK